MLDVPLELDAWTTRGSLWPGEDEDEDLDYTVLLHLDAASEDMQAFQRDCEARMAKRRSSCSRLKLPAELKPPTEQYSLLDYMAMEQDLLNMAASTTIKPDWGENRFLYPPLDLSLQAPQSGGGFLAPMSRSSSTSSHGSGLLSPYYTSPGCTYSLGLTAMSVPISPATTWTEPGSSHGMIPQRQEALQRYRAKKASRMFTKTVRYQLRKANADRRPRIKGRFVKKAEQDRLAGISSRCAGDAAASSNSTQGGPSDEDDENSS